MTKSLFATLTTLASLLASTEASALVCGCRLTTTASAVAVPQTIVINSGRDEVESVSNCLRLAEPVLRFQADTPSAFPAQGLGHISFPIVACRNSEQEVIDAVRLRGEPQAIGFRLIRQ